MTYHVSLQDTHQTEDKDMRKQEYVDLVGAVALNYDVKILNYIYMDGTPIIN